MTALGLTVFGTGWQNRFIGNGHMVFGKEIAAENTGCCVSAICICRISILVLQADERHAVIDSIVTHPQIDQLVHLSGQICGFQIRNGSTCTRKSCVGRIEAVIDPAYAVFGRDGIGKYAGGGCGVFAVGVKNVAVILRRNAGTACIGGDFARVGTAYDYAVVFTDNASVGITAQTDRSVKAVVVGYGVAVILVQKNLIGSYIRIVADKYVVDKTCWARIVGTKGVLVDGSPQRNCRIASLGKPGAGGLNDLGRRLGIKVAADVEIDFLVALVFVLFDQIRHTLYDQLHTLNTSVLYLVVKMRVGGDDQHSVGLRF